MGVSSSRQRRQQQPAPPAPVQPVPPYNQVYPPPSFRPASTPYYGQDPTRVPVNNGQFYGGWRQPTQPYPGPHPAGMQPPGEFRGGEASMQQTATIRNTVNLKKDTLKVVPVANDPTKLAVSFAFDASSACSVSVFIAVTEDPKTCSLSNNKQPAATILYDAGLGLKFPTQGHAAVIVDLVQYGEQQLMRAEGNFFPLVVRMEAVTEKGLREGRTLQHIVPGSKLSTWVQSQTTLAALSHDEEGHYMVKVLKQKIWVEGVSYELQEIYGMEHASGAKAEVGADDAEERLCVICLVNDRDTTVLPCRHMCMCAECAQELRKQTSKCPICRNHVESLLHIKMKGKNEGQPGTPSAPANLPVGSTAEGSKRTDSPKITGPEAV